MADTLQSSPSSNSSNFAPDGSAQTAGFAPTAPAGLGVGVTDQSAIRLQSIQAAQGGSSLFNDVAGQVFNFAFQAANGTPLDPEVDWRLRISMAPTVATLFYGSPSNPLMWPLNQTKGVIFPYTPSISVTHSARYGETTLTHSNYKSYFYEGSEVNSINIQAEFTVQNVDEGQYYMAVIHFLRACTKMFFGNSPLAGTPPPMVYLDGFGSPMFPHVPCVVTSFQQNLPSDVDYVRIPVATSLASIVGNQVMTNMAGNLVRLPTQSTLMVTLQPIYSRTNISNNFSLENYNSGALIRQPQDGTGGFI